MNKKGSMELSVNSIVILVIAIVMLGLILGFVKSKFNSIDKQFTQNEPDAAAASSSDPITVSRPELIVNAGEQLALKFNVYALANISIKDKPWLECNTGTSGSAKINFTLDANGKIGNIGDNVNYDAIVNVPNSLNKGKRLCSLQFNATGPGVSGVAPDTIRGYYYPPKDLVVTVQ